MTDTIESMREDIIGCLELESGNRNFPLSKEVCKECWKTHCNWEWANENEEWHWNEHKQVWCPGEHGADGLVSTWIDSIPVYCLYDLDHVRGKKKEISTS